MSYRVWTRRARILKNQRARTKNDTSGGPKSRYSRNAFLKATKIRVDIMKTSFVSIAAVSVLLLACLFSSPVTALAEGAPDFSVQARSGTSYKKSELEGKYVVLEWFNAGCPYVQRAYDSGAMQKLQNDYTKKGFIWLTVNSTAANHKDYLDAAGLEKVKAKWSPAWTDYIDDKDGQLGKLFGAKTTPHLFVIGKSGALMYRGALDNYPEAGDEADKLVPHFSNALAETAAGGAVKLPETKPYGCSIKYAS